MRAKDSTLDKALLGVMAFVALFGCKLGKQETEEPQGQSLGFGNGSNLGSKSGPGTTPPTITPGLGGGRTTPPTVGEWSSVSEINVRNSSALGCETKMVREWLRVTCRMLSKDNPPTGVQVIRPTGDREYFVFNSGGIASLVMPVRPGVDAEARYTWPKWGTRTLRVSWAAGAPSASMGFDRGDR